MCVEIHADCRGRLLPDPKYDEVKAIALAVMDDDEEVPDGDYALRLLITSHYHNSSSGSGGGGGNAANTATSAVPPSASMPVVSPTTHSRPVPLASTLKTDTSSPMKKKKKSTTRAEEGAPPHFQGSFAASIHSSTPITTTPTATIAITNEAGLDGLSSDIQVDIYPNESSLLDAFEDAVICCDPDILLGYEVQKDSLGYLSDRAAVLARRPLLHAISRLAQQQGQEKSKDDNTKNTVKTHGDGDVSHNQQQQQQQKSKTNPAEEYAWRHTSGITVTGRIVLNMWRLMRSEVKLGSYTMESCAAAVLRRRLPYIPTRQLADWFNGGPGGGRWRCLTYLATRARTSLALLDQLDLVGRTGEMARVFGIDFYSVLSRGSQYRVESMMLRLAKTQNYLAISPIKEDVAKQPAMEALPLVMEPESRMYTDPVIVLDFQSLYPSMVIAYNLCFSTCLGKTVHIGGTTTGDDADDRGGDNGCCHHPNTTTGTNINGPRLGVKKEYSLPPQALLEEGLSPDDIIITPNGVAFTPPHTRPGVLPRLLKEILETRIMVKGAMKRASSSSNKTTGHSNNKILLRCLNARQFSLKLIANVTYGYTAAGFSGRMPMAELADSIVSSGRETLESAIRLVESHPDWKAKVVYGDTDSLFVLLPGRSKEQAFVVGAEIAAVVTAANPSPVTLKLEKVYHPCTLLSKKRYVGMAWMSPCATRPVFDAKGIETVRRDTCPAVAKMMERSLRILFSTKDVSLVKSYLERQWTKILSGRVSIQDFVFAKEVRLGTYAANNKGTLPPAALIAGKAIAADPRAEPRFGERIPYVVVHGEPGARLIDIVVPPKAVVDSAGRLRLHGVYYITKQIIPSLERVFSLIGADLRAWYAVLPRPQRTLPQKRPPAALPNSMNTINNKNNGVNVSVSGGPSNSITNYNAIGLMRRGGGTVGGGGATIDQYYLSKHCSVCDEPTHASKMLCDRCSKEPASAVALLQARLARAERQYGQLVRVCVHCGGGTACESLDCGVMFERKKLGYEVKACQGFVKGL